MATSVRDWLYAVPPVRRTPREPEVSEVLRIGLWPLEVLLWFYELALWLGVWFFYGTFLGLRGGVRTARHIQARRRKAMEMPVDQTYVAPPEPEDARPGQ